MIYWLLKLSQRPIQQIKNAVWDFYRQQNQELEMLRKQLSSMPVTDYFTLVKNDHQINLARHNQKTQQLQFLNSLLPEVHNTNDPQFINLFQQEVEGVQTALNEVPIEPLETDFTNYIDKEVLEFYVEVDKDVNQHIIPLLDANNLFYDTVKFRGGQTVFVTEVDGQLYVIETSENGLSMDTAEEWVENAADYFYQYYPDVDYNTDFWSGVGPNSTVYHATREEYLPSIMKHGLRASSETRGLSNRYTPDAVFASENPDDIDSYGNVVLEINLGLMKADNYTPEIQQETPISEAEQKQSLAHAIGLEDYHVDVDSDLSSTTVVIFGNIPPKYIKRFN